VTGEYCRPSMSVHKADCVRYIPFDTVGPPYRVSAYSWTEVSITHTSTSVCCVATQHTHRRGLDDAAGEDETPLYRWVQHAVLCRSGPIYRHFSKATAQMVRLSETGAEHSQLWSHDASATPTYKSGLQPRSRRH
jgi:hypothetical protein